MPESLLELKVLDILTIDDSSRSTLNAVQREELIFGCPRPKMRTVFYVRPDLRLIKQKAVSRPETLS